MEKQHTIAAPVAVDGIGYWSGEAVEVEFRPAPVDAGITFVRRDLPGKPRIPASVQYRVDIPLRTSLRAGEAQVDMVEHILASLGGLGILNCEVWVDRPEMPGMDGSSLDYVRAIDSVGTITYDVPQPVCRIKHPVGLCRGTGAIEAKVVAEAGTFLKYDLEYAGTSIGHQVLELELTPENFRRELAPARTFLLEQEAQQLRSAGLGERVTYQDLLIYGDDGPIENQLRFSDECVRHKLLDLVGDLTLGCCRFQGLLSARRSGHHLNAELVRALVAADSMNEHYKRCA